MKVVADIEKVTAEEKATLACNIDALNGPQQMAMGFEWVKDSQTLNSSSDYGSPLYFSTASVEGNPYGEYWCAVNNGYYRHMEAILISEKGTYTYVATFYAYYCTANMFTLIAFS